MNENSKYAVFCIVLCQACSFIRIGIGLSYLNPCTPALQNFVNITYKASFNLLFQNISFMIKRFCLILMHVLFIYYEDSI